MARSEPRRCGRVKTNKTDLRQLSKRGRRTMWRIATGLLVTFACLSISGTVVAQSVPEAALPAWQVAAGRKMVFDVASVKPSADQQFRPPAFPLSDDDSFM